MAYMYFVSDMTTDGNEADRISFKITFARRSYRTWRGIRERVRLVRSYAINCYDESHEEEARSWVRYVMNTIALPYRRVNTERTLSQILDALRYASSGREREWYCANEFRVLRRRRNQLGQGEAFGVAPTAPPIPRARPYSSARDASQLQEYGYKPRPVFHVAEGESAPDIYYGVELEIDCHGSSVREPPNVHDVPNIVNSFFPPGMFYCKMDGSLHYGCEIVSHPCSEQKWRDMQPAMGRMLRKLLDEGWLGHSVRRAGIHWHSSRGGWHGALHIYRFLHLLYRNPQFALLVSQRTQSQMDHFASLTKSQRRSLKAKVGLPGGRGNGNDHYDAVNISNKTLELRIFNSTLRLDRFYKNVEFLWAAHHFTDEEQNLRHVKLTNFLPWILEREALYSNLTAFLREHGAIITSRPALASATV